jgi:O-antigen ligase
MSEHNLDLAEARTALPARLADAARLREVADWLVVAVAVSLPWSTSATGILIVLWLVALLPTLDFAAVRRELMTAAGGLPVLLWVLGVIGVLWAQVSWSERLAGLAGFHKLLLVPLLLAQMRRSPHPERVVLGFLASALALLVASFGLALFPDLSFRGKVTPGIPVKDYLTQSGIFAMCAFGLLGQGAEFWRTRRRRLALACAAVAAAFVANVVYVVTARTTLVVIAVLLLLFGLRQFAWRGLIATALIGCALAGLAWTSSPYLRARVTNVIEEVQNYRGAQAVLSSSGTRIQFWIKSLEFVAAAPVIGHGTGSIEAQFQESLKTDTSGEGGLVTRNPHSQLFAVAIQLGLLGTLLLIAMWIAHLALFRDASLMAWFGLVVVASNIVSSLFNSHLFDFTQGWIYVFGLGVTGGAVLARSGRAASGA